MSPFALLRRLRRSVLGMPRGVALLAFLAIGAGCGGAGGTASIGLASTKTREGTMSPSSVLVGNTLNFGDNATNVPFRVALSFSHVPLPAGAEIVSATLVIEQEDTGFGAPFTDLGALLVDHVDLGASLDSADFDGGTLTSDVGTISSTTGNGLRSLDVTQAVLADVAAGRGRSEFRLRFAAPTDDDGAQDSLRVIETANLAGKSDPALMVEFRR